MFRGTINPKAPNAEALKGFLASANSGVAVWKLSVGGNAPATVWAYNSSRMDDSGKGDELAGLVATDTRVVVAATVTNEGPGFEHMKIEGNSQTSLLLASLGTTGTSATPNVDYMPNSDSRVLSCVSGSTVPTDGVRAVALASAGSGNDVVAPLSSTCNVKASDEGSDTIDHKIGSTPVGLFGLAKIDGAIADKPFTGFLPLDLGRDPSDKSVGGTITAMRAGPSGTLFVGGSFFKRVQTGSAVDKPAVTTGSPKAQGFVVPVATSLFTVAEGIATAGSDPSMVTSIDYRASEKHLALGLRVAGKSTLLNRALDAGKTTTPFVALVSDAPFGTPPQK
jgi:hypothetical protein